MHTARANFMHIFIQPTNNHASCPRSWQWPLAQGQRPRTNNTNNGHRGREGLMLRIENTSPHWGAGDCAPTLLESLPPPPHTDPRIKPGSHVCQPYNEVECSSKGVPWNRDRSAGTTVAQTGWARVSPDAPFFLCRCLHVTVTLHDWQLTSQRFSVLCAAEKWHAHGTYHKELHVRCGSFIAKF